MNKYGVEMLWASRYNYKKGRWLGPHSHRYSQVIYFVEGSGVFRYGEEELPFVPGSFFYIRPSVLHSFTAAESALIKTLDMKFHVYEPQLLQALEPIDAKQMDETMHFRTLLECILQEGSGQRIHFRELACLYLLKFVYMLSRCHAELRNEPPAGKPLTAAAVAERGSTAETIRDYIAANCDRELHLADIAKVAGYSKNYTAQLFKKACNCTWTEYLRRVRIEKSKELMAYSEYTLKQIAAAVGFKSIHHFSRIFKLSEGMTPGQWQLKEKRGIRKDILF